MLLAAPFLAQEKKSSEVKAVVSGSVISAWEGNAMYFSLGGPGIKLSAGKWAVSPHQLPSLRLLKDKPCPFITPVLGTGLLVGYKRLIAGLPLYYVASQLKWKAGIGLRVKIGK
jgi:hypothetical protein